MSLVSEALKKAEREAAARDARDKGQPVPFEAPLQPYRSRSGTSGGARTRLFAALGGAAALAALAVLALLWWSSRPEAPVNRDTAATSAPAGTSSADSPSGSGAAPVQEPASAPPAAAHAPATPSLTALATAPPTPAQSATSFSEPTATHLATTPLPKTTLHAPRTLPSDSEPAAPKLPSPPAAKAPARAPEPPTSFGPGDYLRRVDFPDGSKLELGGIVYSEASPFAYINGRLVGVGEFVEGRRIDRIERDKVVLSGDAGVLTLRLKAP